MTAAFSWPGPPANRSGVSPTSASSRRGRPTASRSPSRLKRSPIRRTASATARSTSSRPPSAARRGRSSTATRRKRRGRPPEQRIVYWRTTGGQRDIYTVAAAGGAAGARDAGPRARLVAGVVAGRKFVYFSSDRGGAMNLWRIAVDQSTGQARPRTSSQSPSACRRRARFPRSRGMAPAWSFDRESARSTRSVIPFDPVTLRAGSAGRARHAEQHPHSQRRVA